ncbi:MAG: hypothetical protein H6736_21095 [Alphaproteobacteria bacterium]|nr:hypothetical protein [Alphaproteobacteria bacterium]
MSEMEPTAPSAPTPGELRYFPTVGLVVRVVSYSDDFAVVEHLPGGRHVTLKATKELSDASVVHEQGFRARWCQGALALGPGREPEVLEAIRLDEEANGRDRVRLRVLDEYLAPVVDSDEARERLRTALTGTDAWVKVGRGTELGYVPAGTSVDWRDRWRRDGIRIPRGTDGADEAQAIRVLRDELPSCVLADIGRVAACSWLPHGLRAEAARLLAERWRSGRDRADFRLVVDDAMVRMLRDVAVELDDKGWRDLLISNALSPSVRGDALALWRSATEGGDLAVLFAGLPRVDDVLVAVDLFRFANGYDERVAALANVFSIPAPDDDVGKEATRRLAQHCRSLGVDLLATTVAAVRLALSSRGSVRTVEQWLHRLDSGIRPSLQEVCKALATLEVLERFTTELAALAAPRVSVENGLTRWIRADLPDDLREDVDVAAVARAENGVAMLARHSDARVHSRDYRTLGRWVDALAVEVERLDRDVERLTALVDDRANAERVLGRVAAELTRGERQDLRDSAIAEVESIRQKEREKVARLISESVTAVERLAGAGGPQALSSLSRRLRELCADLDLEVRGQVGDVVVVDPSVQETTAQTGSHGEVRRVGVVDRNGNLLVRPAVVPVREVR